MTTRQRYVRGHADMGYWVPEYAIEALQEEQTEMDNAEAADDPF